MGVARMGMQNYGEIQESKNPSNRDVVAWVILFCGGHCIPLIIPSPFLSALPARFSHSLSDKSRKPSCHHASPKLKQQQKRKNIQPKSRKNRKITWVPTIWFPSTGHHAWLERAGCPSAMPWFVEGIPYRFPSFSWICWENAKKIPSGKRLHNYGKSPFLLGKSNYFYGHGLAWLLWYVYQAG